jgi:hypothetical protein
MSGRGVRIHAYFEDRDHHQGKPLWSALLECLRRDPHPVCSRHTSSLTLRAPEGVLWPP